MMSVDPLSSRSDLPNFRSKVLGRLKRGYFNPFWLINTNAIKDRGEFVTVLCIVNLGRIGSKNLDAAILEPKCNILRQLSWATSDDVCKISAALTSNIDDHAL